MPLLSDEETTMLNTLIVDNPGLEVTPSILLQFIAEKTRHSPSPSPDQQDDQEQPQPVSDEESWRGRDQERQSYDDSRHRSPSNESNNSGSRSPSRGALGRSPFDMERRQRSTPLNNTPSKWTGAKRPAPASRRRSFDGSVDSEVSFINQPPSIQFFRFV